MRKKLHAFATLIVAFMALGCGNSIEPPPELTDDLKSQIKQEDMAVEEQERAQQKLSRSASKG